MKCRTVFPRKHRSRLLATAGCSALGLLGLSDGDVCRHMSFHLLLLSPVALKGYDFGQVRGNDGHTRVQLQFSVEGA